MKHIRMFFDSNDVLHLIPKDDIGMMALKYYKSELLQHGIKMLEVETEVPLMLGSDEYAKKPK